MSIGQTAGFASAIVFLLACPQAANAQAPDDPPHAVDTDAEVSANQLQADATRHTELLARIADAIAHGRDFEFAELWMQLEDERESPRPASTINRAVRIRSSNGFVCLKTTSPDGKINRIVCFRETSLAAAAARRDTMSRRLATLYFRYAEDRIALADSATYEDEFAEAVSRLHEARKATIHLRRLRPRGAKPFEHLLRRLAATESRLWVRARAIIAPAASRSSPKPLADARPETAPR